MDLLTRLRTAAAASVDPEASTRIERFAHAAAAVPGGLAACVPDATAERLLLRFVEQSPHFTQRLVRDPAALAALAHDPWLRREKPETEMRKELDAELAATPGQLLAALRRYRNRAYLRLCARELGDGAPAEVGRELAALASVLLDAAVDHLSAELDARFGPPLTTDGTRARFVVFGMGKLGGAELNFSSDIDLIYVYETDSGAAGTLTLHEYFSRLAERLTRALADVTDDGFCFRVDMRLRPEGSRGPLVNSVAATERYYESWGRPWERQAWLKARPVAGDRALGEETLKILEPFIWPRTSGSDVINAVHALMGRIRAELTDEDDVKLGPGGIREIEFFVQALQLVHGRSPRLRERGTLRALEALLFSGIISAREQRTLATAYDFLRRVEHRLQLEELRQTHSLPRDPDRRALLARRIGFPDLATFEATLARARADVAAIYATLGAPAADDVPHDIALALDGNREALGRLGFTNPDASADELEMLRGRPGPFAPNAADGGRLAAFLLAEAAASPDPDLALRRLVDLVSRRRAAAALFSLAEMHRPLGRLVISLFGTSDFLAKELINKPELVEPLLLTPRSQRIKSRAELERAVTAALDEAADDEASDPVEAQLNALRRIKREEILRIGLHDVAGQLLPAEVSVQISDLAEVMLAAALRIVEGPVYAKYGRPRTALAIVALGKLGGRELTYSSDLDLVFVYGDEGSAVHDDGRPGADHMEIYSRLVQRLRHALDATLEEGRLFEIDTRLRPSGQQGALVSSLPGFRAYHARAAQLWERQALIKARAVAGDAALGQEIEALAHAHVYGGEAAAHPDAATTAQEITRLRARIERELAREARGRFHVKAGRGGLLDVEFLTQYLQLVHGPTHPLIRVRATVQALDLMAKAGIIPFDDARRLVESYGFLRLLENRLRIVHDRSIDEITDDPKLLDGLARRMGYVGDRPGAHLLDDYRAHTAQVRGLYEKYLPTPE
jgi:glutamate-ammonia-ligase adenylyltransferase